MIETVKRISHASTDTGRLQFHRRQYLDKFKQSWRMKVFHYAEQRDLGAQGRIRRLLGLTLGPDPGSDLGPAKRHRTSRRIRFLKLPDRRTIIMSEGHRGLL
jgi:hypothetical protein